MLPLVALLALAAAEPEVKELPPVKEPDWAAWKDVDAKKKAMAAQAWATLREYRPDREYKTANERKEAERKVAAAYKVLDDNPDAACAAGAELLRASKDDWERLMIATTIGTAGRDKGEPFLVWAMARAKTVDDAFDPVFEIASRFAAKRKPEYLPALAAVLRTHDGRIFLQLHSWWIPTQDCLFYVFGRYGPDAISYLRGLLKDPDPYVRRNAAIVLGDFMDRASKPALLKMLEADDVGSGGAAFALGELGDKEAVKPVARLLKNADARTRFWAAYALYELGDKGAVPALEAAAKSEKDEDTRGEMEAALEHLRGDPKPYGATAKKLAGEELRAELEKARKSNGLEGDAAAIAASAGRDELAMLEEIRRKTLDVLSDKGNKRFREWTLVLKTVRRRFD